MMTLPNFGKMLEGQLGTKKAAPLAGSGLRFPAGSGGLV